MRREQWASSENMRLLGHTELGGHGDGMHVNVRGNYAYVGHMGESRVGTSIVDISDRRNPRLVNQIETPIGTHSHKVQIVGDILLVNYERNHRESAEEWQAGLKVFDLSGDPENPKEIAFYQMPGAGVHRMTFWEFPYAYMSGSDTGYTDQFLIILDLSSPDRPQEVGRWWLPGMHHSGGERPSWPDDRRVALHHPLVFGDRAYCGFWDAGMVILDISDVSKPAMVSHLEFGHDSSRCTHTVLPILTRQLAVVIDEQTSNGPGGVPRHGRIVDISNEASPRVISQLPVPPEELCVEDARFGPHNLHEPRPGSFHSESILFLTYFSAGLRVFDISDPHNPQEVAHYIPQCPPNQAAPQLNDVYVHGDGTVFVTDRFNGGLYILEALL